MRRLTIYTIWIIWSASALAADPFAENVRTTPPLSPADEQRSFHLPPGFEMQLVAAEPDIAKPTNLAFDGRGRKVVGGKIVPGRATIQ